MLAPAGLGPLWVGLVGSALTVPLLGSFAGFVLLFMFGTAVYTDTRFHRIPNWLTYPGLLWALGINSWAAMTGLFEPAFRAAAAEGMALSTFPPPLGAVGLTESLLGAGTAFVLMFFVFRLAGGGAGDVKLMTAVGGLLGPAWALKAMICSYLVAGTAILCWAIWSHGLLYLSRAFGRKIGAYLLPDRVLPPSPDENRLLLRPTPLAASFAIGTVTVLCLGGLP